MGHKDAFPRPRLRGRCRFSQRTFTRTRSNGRVVPIPDTRGTATERRASTQSGSFPKPGGFIILEKRRLMAARPYGEAPRKF